MLLMELYDELEGLVASLRQEWDEISPQRKETLRGLRAYLERTVVPRFNFICTHNSRRSHLGMVWAAVAGAVYDRPVATYSGGTEATALNPRMVAALRRAGFRIEDPGGDNPQYRVHFATDAEPLICFSKRYDHGENPSADFAAVMTCGSADRDCPIVPGAEIRFSLTYADPKEADDTPQETQRYDERLRQIGRELLYAFSDAP